MDKYHFTFTFSTSVNVGDRMTTQLWWHTTKDDIQSLLHPSHTSLHLKNSISGRALGPVHDRTKNHTGILRMTPLVDDPHTGHLPDFTHHMLWHTSSILRLPSHNLPAQRYHIDSSSDLTHHRSALRLLNHHQTYIGHQNCRPPLSAPRKTPIYIIL